VSTCPSSTDQPARSASRPEAPGPRATFALVTPGGSSLGTFELDDDETQEGAIIRREGEPDRRVVGRIEFDDPENFEVLVVERVESPPDATVGGVARPGPSPGGSRRPGPGVCPWRPFAQAGARWRPMASRIAEPPVGAT
jgi:hypothetical protein